jgi:hypothetical protein
VNVDTRLFQMINDVAKATPWLHGIVLGYADYGIVVFAALMLAAWWIARRAADPARMAAVVMAFSRVYIATHYPHNVAAGLLAGGEVSLLGFLLVRRVLTWLVTLGERTPLRPALIAPPPPGPVGAETAHGGLRP